MVIVKLMGGLGNQLQQYAFYRKWRALGCEARLDTSWFERIRKDAEKGPTYRTLELNRLGGISYEEASPEDIRALCGRSLDEQPSFAAKVKRKLHVGTDPVYRENQMYDADIFSLDNRYFDGFWACEKYYADILQALRDEITFPAPQDSELCEKNNNLIRQMESAPSVSVHIRRGDYLEPETRALFGGICTEAYYRAAIEYAREKFPGATFFYFSDDAPYVRAKLQGRDNAVVVDWNTGENSFYDMMLMSRCRCNICANSTFSFWGARLNAHADRLAIRPGIQKNTQTFQPEYMADLWKGWTFVTPDGALYPAH